MVNNVTNINKASLPQTIEHNKTKRYGVGNQRHGMRQSHECGGVKAIVNTECSPKPEMHLYFNQT